MIRRKRRLLQYSLGPWLCLSGAGITCVAFFESLLNVYTETKQDSERSHYSVRFRINDKSHEPFSTSRGLQRDVLSQVKHDSQLKGKSKRKIYPKQTNITNYETMQSPIGGAFVHTGKTGGSTLSVLLRNGCHSFVPHPCRTNITHESVASQMIESYYHVPDFGALRQSNHTFYIVTCRDPFDRTISAFVYDHIRNRYARNETISPFKERKYEEAYSCFPTIQQFVELLGEQPNQFNYPHKQNWVSAESCPDLAKAALHSRVKIYNHLFFSFRLLLSFIPNKEKLILYAVRQEHLWDDWTSVNQALGQTSPVYIPTEETNSIRNVALLEVTNQMPVTRELNADGIMLLCNALRVEYQAYFFLLKRAKNLATNDLEQSIQRAKHNCPHLDLDSLLQNV
jgi:Sulfotransferase family